MDSNVIEVYIGKGKWGETTVFENFLDKLDMAFRLRYFLATQEHPHYDHYSYKASQTVTYRMLNQITGDSDISDKLDDLWLDSNSDIRYILEFYFAEAAGEARYLGESDEALGYF